MHRSFGLADSANLADISAKGQAQSVVADNLGLALALGLNAVCGANDRWTPLPDPSPQP